jgi:hypothetical protein
MPAELIFSSDWLVQNPIAVQKHLEDLQYAIIDKMAERDNDVFLVTTTFDFDLGGRNYWKVGIEYQDATLFYQDLMNGDELGGRLEVFEDSDGVLFARYTAGGRSAIWKFHFLHDLENVIEKMLTGLGSFYFEDLRDTLEYTLQDMDYLEHNEELSVDLIEDGLEAEFFIALPYMQDPIVNGTLYYEANKYAAWLVQEGELNFEDAMHTYIEECLY